LVKDTQELLSYIEDAETSQTGYLLTGNARYLVAYNQILSKISLARQVLSRRAAASPGLWARLSALIAAKLDELAETIRLRHQGDAASAISRTDGGKQTTDQIRQLAARVIAQQNDRFREYT